MLGQFHLTGSVWQAVKDVDNDGPEIVPLEGWSAVLTSNYPINAPLPDGDDVTYIDQRTVGLLDDGQISEDGVNPGVYLTAHDDALFDSALQWTIKPGPVVLGSGKKIQPRAWTFNAPLDTESATLGDLTPVAAESMTSLARGPAGPGIDDVQVAGSSVQFYSQGQPIGDPFDLELLLDAVVDGAPDALDTLYELAAALDNDENFAATVTNAIAAKYTKPGPGIPSSDLAAAVVTSLGLADTSIQPNDPLADLDTSVTGAQLDALKTKVDGIEAAADVTDATNVAAAGAVMSATSAAHAPALGLYFPEVQGAVGDGSTNDTAAFTATVSAMPSTGGVISLRPNAVYEINSTWTVAKPVSIKGNGATLKLGTLAKMVEFSGVSNVVIEDLTFDGDRTTLGVGGSPLLRLLNSTNVVVRNCRFLDSPATAIHITTCSDVWIEDNYFNDIQSSGIYLSDPGVGNHNEHIWITGNRIDTVQVSNTAGQGGIQSAGDEGANRYIHITDNTIVNTIRVGIGVDSIDHSWVCGNVVVGEASAVNGEGIAFTGSHNIISGNFVNNKGTGGAAAILLWAVDGRSNDNNQIIDNICTDSGQGVCFSWGEDDAAINNLLIAGNRLFGNNRGVQSFPTPGVTAGSQSDIVIRDNNLVGNTAGAMSIQSAGAGGITGYTPTLSNNRGHNTHDIHTDSTVASLRARGAETSIDVDLDPQGAGKGTVNGSEIISLAVAHAATSKSTPVDADEISLLDSASSYALNRLTWANLKATIKSYYDAVTSTLTNKTVSLASNTLTGTTAQFNTALSDNDFATLAGTETLTGKTISLASNTVTSTLAQLNTAVSDADVASLAGTETLTGKTINLSNNTVSATLAQLNTAVSDADVASLAGSETLTNKTISLASNTVSTTLAQLNTAVSDADVASLAGTESLTNKTLDATNTFTLQDDKLTFQNAADPTKKVTFDLSSITTGTTRLYTMPNNTTGLVGQSSTMTLTNKRMNPRVVSATSASSLTPTIATGDLYAYTALAADLTINAPGGTPVDGNEMVFRIKDNGTSRALTWDSTYRAVGVTLPAATVISKIVYVRARYNAAETCWDVLDVKQQA